MFIFSGSTKPYKAQNLFLYVSGFEHMMANPKKALAFMQGLLSFKPG